MSHHIISTRRIEEQLIARGLVPDNCRLLSVEIGVNVPLVVRYEKFISADELDSFADALKAAADSYKTDIVKGGA